MKKALILTILSFVLFAPRVAYAVCGGIPMGGSCSIPGGVQCSNDPFTCCNPVSLCTNPIFPTPPTTTINPKICDFISEETQKAEHDNCVDCFDNQSGAWTAIGCIQTNPESFIAQLLGFGVGIAGGIAFLLILFGALQVMTSSGNPEKLHAGQELITAAITGLLFIIFSVFLLKLIGYDILRIPGFGT